MELSDTPRYRPMAFDKMESLIREMQDPETGVPVRSQKIFLSIIPSVFMGYDLIEWLMERFNLDETSNEHGDEIAGKVEAINLANQLCQYGYFFPINDSKNLVLKDDSSLYRFQSPYYWPWQGPRLGGGSSAPTLGPDNVEYAIYLVKRTLRNRQRHGLEEYEQEALANLKKNLAAKWDFITMQAEEQVRLAKERKKGDKIVSDSQERAFWRVARPPPGVPSALDTCPVPVRARSHKPKRKTTEQVLQEIEFLKASLDRTRVKTSIALEALLAYSETFTPYDPWLTPPLPSNPWISDDTTFWQINSPLVDVPSEKRVQRWALSIEELLADPTGLQEFTSFLRKEYSHENIRFWQAVMDLRRSSTKDIARKLDEIYEEFLKPHAPCEINIDGATMERVSEGIRSGSRYALDHAADHVYRLLLKKDCYPRFVRSDHFQRLLNEGKNVHQKKAKFFNFGGQVKKKPCAGGAALSRRRGSDRSLSGSAHELAVHAAPPRPAPAPPHSHSQSNLADIPRDPIDDDMSDVAPWECCGREGGGGARRRLDSAADSGSSSSDVSAAISERRRLPQQSTLDGGLRGAPPPLRRLSAVEPRHLAPLTTPAPPRPTPPPAPAAAPYPTPTISVSSAPDDEDLDERHSPEPSVFATPTDDRSLARVPSDEAEELTEQTASSKDSAKTVDPPAEAETSTSAPVPTSVPKSNPAVPSVPSTSGSTVVPATLPAKSTPTLTKQKSVEPKMEETGAATLTAEKVLSADAARPSEPSVSGIHTADNTRLPVESKGDSSQPQADTQIEDSPRPPVESQSGDSPRPPVAPLAECEDSGVDDDNVDKVPSAPQRRVSAESKPASREDATKTIAHKDDESSLSENIVKRDNNGGLGEHRQCNDVCPWEDENSCESDAPFVKTYATLGYL